MKFLNLFLAVFFLLPMILAEQSQGAKNYAAWKAKQVVAKTYAVHSNPQVFEQIIKPMLSKKGSMVYMANRRAFIIVDTEAVHRKVEPIFKVAVRNPVRIKVDVEFEGERRLQKRGIFVRSNGKLGVSVGVDRKGVHLPGSLDVDIINRKETEDSYQKIMLMTMSGKAARIWSIQTEPVLSSLRHYQYQRHGYYSGQSAVVSELNFEEKTVGVSLWMKPTYSDDGLISVDVYPVLTGRVKGQKRSYRVNEVETTVVVQNNKRVHIGGHHKKINHFLSQLFAAYGKESGKDLLDIYLTAYAEKMHRKK